MTSRIAVVLVAAVAVGAAACGASDDDPLAGAWQEKAGDMLLRFDPDGSWVVDTDGSLDDDTATGGRYELAGRHLSFSFDDSSPCFGDTLAWDISFTDDDDLDADVVDGGCTFERGQHVRLVRRDEK